MRDELTSAWHEVTPDARSIFMKMEPSPPPRVCQYHASVRVQWKVGRVYSIGESITGSACETVNLKLIFFVRALSLSFFFTSFFLSLRLSSSYLEINEKEREREREGEGY